MAAAENDTRALRQLKSLLEVSQVLASEVELDRLLRLILSKATEVMEAERSTIFLYDEDLGALRSYVSGQIGRDALTVALGTGIAGQVAATLEILNIPDAYADPRFNSSFDAQTGFRTRNILCGPVLSREGRLLGVVQLLNKTDQAVFSPEDEAMLSAFASMAGVAIERARLVAAAVESQRVEESLRLAHDIQMEMLVRHFPRGGVTVDAVLEPAREVGGDFYDVVEQGGRVWFTVGDVSGKGMGAALFMAITLTLFRASTEVEVDPARVLGSMNRALSRHNERAMFVTVFAACLETGTGNVTYANGGHNPPYVHRASGELQCLENATSPALGVFEEATYANRELNLGPGDSMFLYTDGVTEAEAADGSFYGVDRLEALLRTASASPAERVQDALRDVKAFAKGAPPSDDLTVLAVRLDQA